MKGDRAPLLFLVSKGGEVNSKVKNLFSFSCFCSFFSFYFLVLSAYAVRADELSKQESELQGTQHGVFKSADAVKEISLRDLAATLKSGKNDQVGQKAATDVAGLKVQDLKDKLAASVPAIASLERSEGLTVAQKDNTSAATVTTTPIPPALPAASADTPLTVTPTKGQEPDITSGGEQKAQNNADQPSNLQPSNLQPSNLQPSNLQPSNLQPSTPSTPAPTPNPSTDGVTSPPLNTNPNTPAELAPGEVRILTPQSGVVGAASTNLVVQYRAGEKVLLTVNKKPLDTKAVQTQIEPGTGNSVTQAWYNIPLEKGENILTVQAGDGKPVSVQINVKDATASSKIEIAPAGSAIVQADGRSTITLEGMISDDKGELIRSDTVVTLTASAGKFVGADYDKDQAGFQVLARQGKFSGVLQSGLEAQKVRIRAAVERRLVKDPRRRVLPEGNQGTPSPIAQPPTSSISNPISPDSPQNVGIPPNSNNPLPTPTTSNPANPLTPDIEAYTQVDFVTYLRPPLTTGVVNLRIGSRTTDFFGPRANFLNPERIGKGSIFDLGGAVFSTGKVGDWLFTGAYNSTRPLNQNCDYTVQLFRGSQFCDQKYPVYGDSSTVDYLTPSKDSLYLRFERTSKTPGAEPDYGMWGDYSTREFARASQLFSATNRNLHGFKANYSFGNLQITGLYSNDVQGLERDTIVPNGTSGYYFLSRRLIVPGSENVFLESEEINRPGTVLERKPLSRGTDYEIDYDRGTLLFRRPILATELNPFGASMVRRIVTTYQYENSGGGNNNIYAGRVQYNFTQGLNQTNSWIGGSYQRENQGQQNFELYGADFLVPLGKDGQLVGEYAHSRNNSIFLREVTGNAYRIEAYGLPAPWLRARTYYRNVEAGFANNATTSFSPGQTRYGAQIAASIGTSTQFTASYDHERNYGIAQAARIDFFDPFNPRPRPVPGSRLNNSLTEVRAGVLQKFGAADLSLEYVNRSRTDRASTGLDGDSSQLVSRLSVPLTSTLAFRAQNELHLSGKDPLYPSRSTFGLSWAAFPGVNVQLAHQFINGSVFGRNSITSLDTIMERQLGENTSITGRYSLLNAYNSITGQGAVGLNHRIVLAPGLRVNVGYEHIFNNLFARTAAGQQFEQPYTRGQTAAILGLTGGDAYSVGVEYTDNPNFQASARFEYRTGSGASNTVITAGAAGKISPSLTALLRYEQANAANLLLQGLPNTRTVKLGLAYRNPVSDQFNALLSYEFRQNPSTIPETLLLGSGTGSQEHVLAAEAIYAPSWRWEFYGKYAMRDSTTYLSSNFSNNSFVYLGQLRAAYRLGYRMDLAGEVRVIGQPSVNYNELGFAVETGYYLTPDLRFSLGYSFGRVNDRDFSGYRSEGGPYLGVTLKVNELFGGFGRQKVAPPQQQESVVKPVARGTPTPSSGTLTPSSGTLTPSPGDSTPSPGTPTPSPGNLTPSPGNLTPSLGTLTPSPGNLTPSPGNLTPSLGNLTPSSGNLTPSSGTLTPSPGTLTPSSGNPTLPSTAQSSEKQVTGQRLGANGTKLYRY